MASRSKTLQIMIYILISLFIQPILGQEIYFHDSDLLGIKMTTRNGSKIDAYLGIPYAIPPVGPRRFRNPEPIPLWKGVLEAKTDANQCPQIDKDGSVVGNEDCLYLNVYAPEWKEKFVKPFPVMVYIHGGDFVSGNGSSTLYGPQYLLDGEVILVTLNYRLGVLGFLSTGNMNAPGNFGLKDQLLALKWVKDNIHFFEGNPNEITIFGEGAGGASVSLHSVSPASKGIFQRLIAQSGMFLCFWAFNEIDPYKLYAIELGNYVGCRTSNSEALVDCLRELDIKKIVNTNDIFKNEFYRFSTWGPTQEPQGPGAFLTKSPIFERFVRKSGGYPAIVGTVRDEGLVMTAELYSNETLYKKYTKHLDAFVRYILSLSFKDELDHYSPTFEDFYFNGTNSTDKETFLQRMTDLISDAAFIQPADADILQLYTSHINSYDETGDITYFYSFDYRGTISETSCVTGDNDNIGVTHTDELKYLFPRYAEKFCQQQVNYNASDELMIDTMIELWTSFAHTGIPHLKSFPEKNFWIPYSAKRDYLKIGNGSNASVSRHDHFEEKRLDFWFEEITDQILVGFAEAFGRG